MNNILRCVAEELFQVSTLKPYSKLGMKTEWIQTELNDATFVSIFCIEVETNMETPEINTKTNIVGKKYRSNMARTRNIK